jgi:hypothetical protein
MFTGIDVCIPCFIKLITGHKCPGCGLTRAFIYLIKSNPKEAYNQNPLIFIVFPSCIFYIITDFLKFKKKFSTQYSS